MILKCDGKAAFVVAEEVHERGFDFRSLLIDLGIMRATRTLLGEAVNGNMAYALLINPNSI